MKKIRTATRCKQLIPENKKMIGIREKKERKGKERKEKKRKEKKRKEKKRVL